MNRIDTLLSARRFGALAVALTLVAVPTLSNAQPPPGALPPSPGAGLPPEVMKAMTEFQTLEKRLTALREKATQSPALKKELAALKDTVNSKMKKAEPDSAKKMAKFEKLKAQFEAASKGGNKEAARKLVPELQTLSSGLATLQKKVLDDPKLKARAEAFEKNLLAAMKKLDPEAPKMMNRMEALSMKLRGAFGAPPPGR